MDGPVFKIEEVRKNRIRILKSLMARESSQFLGDLVMAEWKNDIAQVVKDDFDGREKRRSFSYHLLFTKYSAMAWVSAGIV